MTTGPPYNCKHCPKKFESSQAKASHVAGLRNRIEPTTKLLAVRAVAADLGRPPTIVEMNEHGDISGDSVADEFGTWNEGIRAAGLDPVNHHEVSDDEILTAIDELASELGHAPRQSTWQARGRFGLDTVTRAFGTWTAAVRKAGYTPIGDVIVNGRIPEQEVTAAIRELADELDRAPAAAELREHGAVTPQTVRARFGTYKAGVRAAGLDPYDPREYDETILLEALRELGTELGRPPTIVAMDDRGSVSASAIRKRFGSWNEALAAAGFDVNREQKITDEDLICSIREFAGDIGHVPSWREGQRYAEFSTTTYQQRFGSWAEALEAAGYEPGKSAGGTCRYYGPNWEQQRERALERDNETCQMPGCTVTRSVHREQYDADLHVHHVQPLRSFERGSTLLPFEDANALENLVTLCAAHHPLWEQMTPLVPDVRHRER